MNGTFNYIMMNLRWGNYRYIGSGSCRDVFDLGNGYVVKVARNLAGIAQNKSEYKISHKDNSGLFAKVVQVSNDFSMLIMEKADKINNISYIWRYFNASNEEELVNSKELQKIKQDYNLVLGDLERQSSWGIIDGRPVIIDYGFTKDVSRKYYS
ncbi:hypothetical protein [Clostridium sp.]|uniref:hypothetical protein n=1 Tax=Clostridium sp. TaxID=1506 RepID=UPI00283F223C|nr:hypothetical protein [Clostridium sp.]MDR3596839.1 hypothetical protein [Clostridium sp.]